MTERQNSMNGNYDEKKIKRRLEAMREKLLGNAQQRSKKPIANPDSGDLARRYDRWQRSSSLDQMLQKRLTEIDSALIRFEEGRYGVCTSCGKPISKARLEALPQTPLCLQCRRKREKKFAHH
jgi:RNA polymerase-binding transcription factor DksA